MGLKFILSQKGKKQLVFNNYIYGEYYRNKSTVFWRCVEYQKQKCTAKVHTTSDKSSGKILEEGKKIEHNHIVEKCDIEALKVKNKIKKFAKVSSESSMNIVTNVPSKISPSTSASLPLNQSLTRNIQRQRNKILGGPALPASVDELVVPEMFINTICGVKFLQHDFCENGERTLIYTTLDNLKILKHCKVWQGDGTFGTVPNLFDQLYTIHGRFKENLLPLVYIVTTDRTGDNYKLVLQKLLRLNPKLKPTSFIIDFEIAFIDAFQIVFPDCDMHGCNFHWGQCIWRKLQQFGMQNHYQEDDEFSLKIRHLLAIAFVKQNEVQHYYDILKNSAYFIENEEYLRPLLDYFEPTWIVRIGARGSSKEPRFAIELWNYYDCVINQIPRTNNGVEGWHNAFSSKINAAHASIWKFLHAIQLEQSLTENKISDINAHKISPKTNKKYQELNRRLYEIVSNYDEDCCELEYLKSIAINVRF